MLTIAILVVAAWGAAQIGDNDADRADSILDDRAGGDTRSLRLGAVLPDYPAPTPTPTATPGPTRALEPPEPTPGAARAAGPGATAEPERGEPVPQPEPAAPVENDVVSIIHEVFGQTAGAALSVAWCESRFNPGTVGAAGERGLFQIHPTHWFWLDEDRLFDPLYNAQMAFELSRGGTNWSSWAWQCQP